MSPADTHDSSMQHALQKVGKARYFTVSLLVHVGLVVLLGSAVLFHNAVELPDFLAGDGELLDNSVTDNVPPPPPAATAPTFQVNTPKVQAPDITAITSTAAPTQDFVMNATPVIAPVKIDSNMDNLMEKATQSIGKVGGVGTLPSTMAGRSGGGRGTAMKKFGMKERSEKAVLAGLRWLVKNQNADGTWGKDQKGAMTGLGLLCFLGHGEVPASAEFGPTVSKAMDAIIKSGEKNDGWVHMKGNKDGGSHGSYSQGIAAYALGEAYTLTKDERIAPVLEKAIAHIVAGQAPDGGWMYGFNKEMPSDTSVSGWQIQALKGAHLTGLEIPKVDETLDKAMENLLRVQNKKSGQFGYRKPDQGKYSLTGVGVLCQQVWKANSKSVREGIDAIENGPKVEYKDKTADLYAWYYNTQACLMKGGSTWTKWNKMFQDEIAEAQNADGSWPPHGGKEHGGMNEMNQDAAVYRTTLCVLMLEVFYRYLPTTK